MENRALGVEGVEVGATRWSQGRWAQLSEGSRRAPVGMGSFCILTENIHAPARDRITHTHTRRVNTSKRGSVNKTGELLLLCQCQLHTRLWYCRALRQDLPTVGAESMVHEISLYSFSQVRASL